MFYGEGEPEEGLAEGEAQIQIGRMIPLLQVINVLILYIILYIHMDISFIFEGTI